jgi:hypothetical protein
MALFYGFVVAHFLHKSLKSLCRQRIAPFLVLRPGIAGRDTNKHPIKNHHLLVGVSIHKLTHNTNKDEKIHLLVYCTG